MHLYITIQKFGVGKILCFWKKTQHTHQGCIYLIKNTFNKKNTQNSNNVKYYYNLKYMFSMWIYLKM